MAEKLIRAKLITKDQAQECASELTQSELTVDDFLRVAKRRGVLTAFHVERINKDEIDDLVLGDYRLLYKAAAGSFARVFKAERMKDGAIVAIKLLRHRHATIPAEVARFHREAKLLMSLRHENIVPIYDVDHEDERHFFVMEFISGGNLRDLVKSRQKFSSVDATKIVYQIAAGLEYALARGVGHRDLKGSNVLMSDTGVVKLVDFGLAGHEDAYGLDDQRAVEYATLEKASRAPLDDARSDLFFLGAIYYQLVTGQSPFRPAKTVEERKDPTRYMGLKPVRMLNPGVSPKVAPVIEKLLRFEPEHRHQSPTELKNDLREVLTQFNEPIPGEKPKPIPKAPLEKPRPTVLCVDHRPKMQDRLREYLSRRGFRVLLISDISRVKQRLRNSPPDALLMMGESIGDEIFDAYNFVQDGAFEPPIACVAVLNEEQGKQKDQLLQTGTSRILAPPIMLRDLRRELYYSLQKVLSDSRMIMLPDVPDSNE
ncbi:Serine/threonine-protein kinase StkP [Calycomorphotria hydatis]|uniref:Serine/threonine-protein kinase StkP n=2 Tax=Calycomorphotria hydatis TaxID=2528027 RepID=A0A517T6C1_9PLAN|nr:Serine/threonine-protein kinase StkP [Calycomorphotria hydatis]